MATSLRRYLLMPFYHALSLRNPLPLLLLRLNLPAMMLLCQSPLFQLHLLAALLMLILESSA